MNKDNILYAITGIIAGLIIGFLFANSYMRSELATGNVSAATAMPSNSNMPVGHPDISGQQQSSPISPDFQPAIDTAKANPTNFEAQMKAAELLNQSEKYDEAIEFLKVANKLKPDDYETIVNLGNVSFDSGKFDEAEKWYLVALEKKNDDTNVRTDLGLSFVFREKPNYDRAIQEFNVVLEQNPNHIQALQNSIVAYLKKGDALKAKENLAKLESVDPKNRALPSLKEQLNKLESN